MSGLIWLSIEKSGGLLYTRQWTFWFHKILGQSWVAEQLEVSQEELSSMALVIYVEQRRYNIRDVTSRCRALGTPHPASQTPYFP
jgi:hypothetical protein